MLTHITLDKLKELKLIGMAKGLEEQMQMPEIHELDFYERLGLIVDREMVGRQNRRLKTRLRHAKLRQPACLEDIDYRQPRGLDKSLLASLASCQWLTAHRNIFITCLLYTSDAADEEDSVDLGGRRIIKTKK